MYKKTVKMESQSNVNQGCGCSDGCCATTKKSSLWKRLVFCAIVLAAGTIITVKLVAKNNETATKCCPTEATKCCPTEAAKCSPTEAAKCSPQAAPACCPQPAPAK